MTTPHMPRLPDEAFTQPPVSDATLLFSMRHIEPHLKNLSDEAIASLLISARTILARNQHAIIAAFLERSGQWVTNEATALAAKNENFTDGFNEGISAACAELMNHGKHKAANLIRNLKI